ncbi:MAG: hypothetical protein GT589_04375 [Peptoclostridium sp.]|uniref:hypothetical protein n=1 Tax=Peptoclostridium sp. TaxID=1904860 RepID=UPI00139C4D13|nr:hypothetical protein [Peptoclostridium sp.]MZQ75378.1 hypothetical protein [Peptoclostridium sp.]
MNPMLKKLVDQNFMTEAQAAYLEEAVGRQDTVIVSGHKGWGILPLMATLSAVAKSKFSIKQVKGFDDLADEAQYYIIADLSDIDFAKLIADTISIKDTSMITIKDPDHPFSLYKILGDVYKATGDTSKTFQVAECCKENGEKKLAKITQVTYNESGKLVKVDFK